MTILKGRSYYPVKVQYQIILACCLLDNLIRREMPVDPLEYRPLDENDSDDNKNSDCYMHLKHQMLGQLGETI